MSEVLLQKGYLQSNVKTIYKFNVWTEQLSFKTQLAKH